MVADPVMEMSGQMQQEYQSVTVSEAAYEDQKAIWDGLIQAVRAHGLIMLTVFLLTVVSSYLIVQMRTEMYETSASILVKLGRENLEAPATVEKGSVYTSGVRREEINSEINLLLSSSLIAATVDKIGLDAFKDREQEPREFFMRLRFMIKKKVRRIRQQLHDLLVMAGLEKRLDERTRIISALSKQIKARHVRDSDVISISVLSPNPVLAERILEVLLNLYQSKHVEVRRSARIRGFFQTQAKFFKARIKELEQQRNALREHRHISSIADQREQLLKRLNALYSELGELLSQRAMLVVETGKGSPGQRGIAGRPGDAMALLVPLQERLTQLKLQRAKMLQTFESDAVIVKTLEDEIATVEHLLADTLEQRIRLWKRRAGRLEKELASLNDAEIQLQALVREQKLSEQNYFNYSKRKEDARISDELDLHRVSNIAIMSRPRSTFEPVQPRKLLIMGLSLPVGLVLGFVLALILEYFNDTIRSYRDLAGIKGLTYLGEFRRSSG